MTPIGNDSRAAISATDGLLPHIAQICALTSFPGHLGALSDTTASTGASSGRLTRESVRPAVSVYGRTRLGWSDAAKASGSSIGGSRVLRRSAL